MQVLEIQSKCAIESVGYQVKSIDLIPEGTSHNTFSLITTDGPMIARFEKPIRLSLDGVKRDFQYNSPLSLQREKNVLELVKGIGLPAPEVYGLHQSEQGEFLLVEQLSGMYWSEYLEKNNYSLDAYLRSLSFLGNDLGRVHQVSFDSFGDVMGKNSVSPGTITNFSERIGMITQLKLQRAQDVGALNEEELSILNNYFQTELTILEESSEDSLRQSALILADLHPRNIFVNDKGQPSGYFDLEFCQAGNPALELYMLRFSFLNYFEGVSEQAENAFFEGYRENGGTYDPQNLINKKLENILAVGHLIGAVTSYFNAADGLRDSWSKQFKQIMFDAINDGEINYQAANDVLRAKTKQPRFATM